jgi:uncharacterized protein YdaT
MPWNTQDYPDALQNFDPLLRKKMIDIANAMEEAGYDEDELIPIAIDQGKEWYNNASEEEIEEFEAEDNPSKTDDHDTDGQNPDLMDNDVEVKWDDDEKEWLVKTVGAEKVSNRFDNKDDALERANDIARNKNTRVVPYTKDGARQD